MAKTFTSQLKVTTKGGGSGNPNINKVYNLHTKDEMELMAHSEQLTGLQNDVISANRNMLVSDPSHANRKTPQGGGVSLTISVKTDGSDGVPAYGAEISWHALDPQQLQAALNAVNTRLQAVGITP